MEVLETCTESLKGAQAAIQELEGTVGITASYLQGFHGITG